MTGRPAALLGLTLAACGAAAPPVGAGTTPDPLDSITADELYRRGVEIVETGDYVRGEQYLAAALDRGYSEDAVMPLLIAACVRSSRLSAALRYAEPYLDRHPDAWNLRLLVATIHEGLGDAEQARRHLLRVAEDQPTEPTASYLLGVLSRDAFHDGEAARAYFARYLELAPDGDHAAEARGEINHPSADGATAAAPPPVRVEPEPARRMEAAP